MHTYINYKITFLSSKLFPLFVFSTFPCGLYTHYWCKLTSQVFCSILLNLDMVFLQCEGKALGLVTSDHKPLEMRSSW